ncbi:hypothetical protein FHX52_3018 [Humibacillus xanthopallidus]|uniref:Uncharacterized protein n=1 Tax=Humibacillus xanthopallidus TaxID=412689 RepID=A0A543PQG4_9MICO|nr:hypothetical protein FHX52_3018 [Humibacillus xanthopallidus]
MQSLRSGHARPADQRSLRCLQPTPPCQADNAGPTPSRVAGQAAAIPAQGRRAEVKVLLHPTAAKTGNTRNCVLPAVPGREILQRCRFWPPRRRGCGPAARRTHHPQPYRPTSATGRGLGRAASSAAHVSVSATTTARVRNNSGGPMVSEYVRLPPVPNRVRSRDRAGQSHHDRRPKAAEGVSGGRPGASHSASTTSKRSRVRRGCRLDRQTHPQLRRRPCDRDFRRTRTSRGPYQPHVGDRQTIGTAPTVMAPISTCPACSLPKGSEGPKNMGGSSQQTDVPGRDGSCERPKGM